VVQRHAPTASGAFSAQELKIKHAPIVWPAMPQLRKTLFLVLLCMGSMAHACGPPGVFEHLPDGNTNMVRDGTVKRTVERHFGPRLSSHYRWISAPATAL
jgi:hypothetical protein